MPYFLLSDEQIAVIQELLETVRNLPPRTNRVYDDTHQAPEVYIAKPPVGGIPGLLGASENETGSGTDTTPAAGDTPGVAECDVYKIVDGEMLFAGFSKQQVYNISETAIAETEWVQIQRDKFGKWLAITGGGTTTGDSEASAFCGRIRFTLVSAGTGGLGDTIEGRIESRPYGCDLVHGEEASGLLILTNPLGLDLEDGLVGFASFQTSYDGLTSAWEIDSLTCPST